MFHLATIAVMNPDIPYEFITALGDTNLASAVVTFWDRGVSAEYVNTVRGIIAPKNGIFATVAFAKMLGDARDADASAEYFARGVKMKLKPADIIRMASEGVPFEYLAAYYDSETV